GRLAIEHATELAVEQLLEGETQVLDRPAQRGCVGPRPAHHLPGGVGEELHDVDQRRVWFRIEDGRRPSERRLLDGAKIPAEEAASQGGEQRRTSDVSLASMAADRMVEGVESHHATRPERDDLE